MGSDLQVDGDGNVISANTSSYIWLDKVAFGEAGSISMRDLLPTIRAPLSTDVLSRLLSSLKVTMKHNFLSSLLVVAGG